MQRHCSALCRHLAGTQFFVLCPILPVIYAVLGGRGYGESTGLLTRGRAAQGHNRVECVRANGRVEYVPRAGGWGNALDIGSCELDQYSILSRVRAPVFEPSYRPACSSFTRYQYRYGEST